MTESEDVTSHLPQRPPFLFVDKILEFDGPGKKLRTEKYLTGKEDFFQGHFPGNPIMPGVLLCEALFQTGAIFLSLHQGQREKGLGVVTRIESTKFKHFVRPGDTLQMEVALSDQLENAFYFKGKIRVKDKAVLSLQFACALVAQEEIRGNF